MKKSVIELSISIFVVSAENSQIFSLRLQEVQIPIINYKTCKMVYQNAVKPHEHLCGGDFYYGSLDACKVCSRKVLTQKQLFYVKMLLNEANKLHYYL